MKIIGNLSQNVCGSNCKPIAFAFDESYLKSSRTVFGSNCKPIACAFDEHCGKSFPNVFGSNCKPIAFVLMKIVGNLSQNFLAQM